MMKISAIWAIAFGFCLCGWSQAVTVERKAGLGGADNIQQGIHKCAGDNCAVIVPAEVGPGDLSSLPDNLSLIDYRRFLAPLRIWNNPSTNNQGQVAGFKVNIASADQLSNPASGDFVAGYFYIDSL